jgi:hypothetical protein
MPGGRRSQDLYKRRRAKARICGGVAEAIPIRPLKLTATAILPAVAGLPVWSGRDSNSGSVAGAK